MSHSPDPVRRLDLKHVIRRQVHAYVTMQITFTNGLNSETVFPGKSAPTLTLYKMKSKLYILFQRRLGYLSQSVHNHHSIDKCRSYTSCWELVKRPSQQDSLSRVACFVSQRK